MRKFFKLVNPKISEGVLTLHGTDVRDALHYICNFLSTLFITCQEHKSKIAKMLGKSEDDIDEDMFLDIEGPASHILDWYEGYEKDLLDGMFNGCYAGWDEDKQQYNNEDYYQHLKDVIWYFVVNHNWDSLDNGEEHRNYCLKKLVQELRDTADEYEKKYNLK